MENATAGFMRQVGVCFGRCKRAFVNDRGWKAFVSVVLITLLVGMVMGKDTFVSYADTKNGAYALVCACIWIGIFNSVRSICRERDIVRREHRTGLNVGAYMLAHWLYEACLCAVESVLVVVVVRMMSADHFIKEPVFLPAMLELYVSFFLITFSADVLGLLVSSVVHDENTAMTVMPFVLIIQLVMAGVIFKLEGITDLISNLTISRWGFDALCATSCVDHMIMPPSEYYGVMEEQASTVGNLMGLWFTLAGFSVIYGILAAVALSFVDRG